MSGGIEMPAVSSDKPRRVVVTGIGVVSPLGCDKDEYFSSLLAGRSGVKEISRFDASEYPVRIAAEVKGFEPRHYLDKKVARRMDAYARYAVGAAFMAREDAGLALDGDPYEVGAYVGSGVGGLDTFYEQSVVLRERGPDRVSPLFIPMMIPNMAAANVSIQLGLKGPISSTSTACAASTNALGDAFQLIRNGQATAMFAGGAEAPVNEVGVAAFAAMRALSSRNDEPEKASRPFDMGRDGFVIGEGAAILVLEERERALARGARIYAELIGYGMSGDAMHLTEPDESGKPAAVAMRRAIDMAGVDPEELDYVNAHGTSTPLGDVMESNAIRLALGTAADRVKVTSTKSMIGHCLGAAGALEAVATVMTLAEGKIPPTINLDEPDPRCPLDYVPNAMEEKPLRFAASNSFGFGGHNATIVFGHGS